MKQKCLTLLLAVFMMVAAFSMNSEAAETEAIPIFEELSEIKERPEIEELSMLEEAPVLERMNAFSKPAVFAGAQDQWEIYDGGYCADGVTRWAITTDGILMFYTDGSTRGHLSDSDYDHGSGPWSVYKKYIWWIIFDGTIDNVCESMFHKYPELMYVDILDGVKSIGRGAFAYCPNLEEVVLADTITSIGGGTFFDCDNLVSINIPKSLKVIPGEFIRFCEKVKTITIPNGVTEISGYAFAQTGIENMVIPNSVKTIGVNTFATSQLKTITLPNGLTEIKDQTFLQCWNLTTVNIPSTVTKIGERAFERCYSLSTISIPGSVKTIGNQAFVKCTGLKKVVLPNSVTQLGEGIFTLCSGLKEVVFPTNITRIPRATFDSCISLQNYTIPSHIKTIGEYAFSNCTNLESIKIPETVTSIEAGVFSGCTKLKKVVFPNSVTQLGESVFSLCSGLKEVEFPANITRIPRAMFDSCTGLQTIAIPSQIKTIGEYAFSNCKNLERIRIPENVTAIEKQSFLGCAKLGKVYVMNKNTTFGSEVFKSAGSNLSILCHENSTAHTYAVNNNHSYQFIDMSKVTDYFADIPEGKWYVNAVQYVFDKELMSGSGEYFNPTKNVTRAQLVTTLYRLAGSPEVTDYSACTAFSDVAEGKYYTDAICWAYKEGIATGNDGKFNTTGNLTRQQMATFFFRFAETMGYDVTDSADFSAMLNADKVSDYAVEAMSWAVGAGLISGSETKDEAGNVVYDLNPRGNTTRVQLSAILQRFCEGFVNVERPEPTPEVTPEPSDGDELPGVPIS